MTEFNALRPITQRLTATPVKELPYIAYFLASSIANCSQALQAASDQVTSRNNDNVVLVHKLKTRISSLLHDRSQEGRFTAVVLVKAVVEAGGREVLGSSDPWVRGLLAILGKTDAVSTKKLSLITITRIFSLTQQYPTLVREITTPLLPAFITACLALIKPSAAHSEDGTAIIISPFLQPVFSSLSDLLPQHPTIFRPFTARLKSIALALIGDASTSPVITDVANNILATLHFSASKNAAGAEWVRACKSIILSCHIAAEQVFRSVVEDWECSEQMETSLTAERNYGRTVQAGGPDAFGLSAWIGVHHGTQRLCRLIRLLVKLLSRQTAQDVSCPIGLIIDLAARLNAVRAIADARAAQFSARLNAEVCRDEREELWMQLPNVHIATLDLLSTILESFSEACLPVARIIFDQTMNIFEAEQRNDGLRIATYGLTEKLLSLVGYSLTRSDVNVLAIVVKRCCADLITQANAESPPVNGLLTKTNGSKPSRLTPIDADSFLSRRGESFQSHPLGKQEPVYQAAFRLLPCFLSNLPARVVPHSLRTEIDRTAILNQNRRALLASVLNPPLAHKGQYAPPSVVPFLARASSGDPDMEGLLRPRMPLIRNEELDSNGYVDLSEEEDSAESQAADHVEIDVTSNADFPQVPDLLDRLEHSLDNSPVYTKHDITGLDLKRAAVEADEASTHHSSSRHTTKRDLVAMNDPGLNYNLGAGVEGNLQSRFAAESSITNINKRRRLEDDPRIFNTSENEASTTLVEVSGLHTSETKVAVESSSLHVSTPEERKKGIESVLDTFARDAGSVEDSDDGSDFEIPQIIDSFSEDEEE